MIAAQGKPADTETEFRQILDARRRVQGPDHPDTLAPRRLGRSPSTPRPKPTGLQITPSNALTWVFSMDADNFWAYLGSRGSGLPKPCLQSAVGPAGNLCRSNS